MKDAQLGLGHLVENHEETSNEGETVRIKGNLPAWAQGSIFTVGPGKFHFEETNFTVEHLVDGFALISKFEIKNGNQITLNKRYEQSDALRKANAAGRPVMAELFTKSSTDVTKNRFSRFMTFLPESSDNGNHNVYFFGDKLYTTNGLRHFREINQKDLSSGEKYDTEKIFGVPGLVPHPLLDEEGNLYTTGGAISPTGGKQNIYKIPAPKPGQSFGDCAKKVEIVGSFPMSRLLFVNVHHSFAMTENYFLLVEQPYVISVQRMMGWIFGGSPTSLCEIAEWHGHVPNQFIVIDKKTGKVQKRTVSSVEAFFFLHFANCYEDAAGNIVADILAYPNHKDTELLFLDKMKSGLCCSTPGGGGSIQRFIIPLGNNNNVETDEIPLFGGEVMDKGDGGIVLRPGHISETGLHALTINPAFSGKKYRYIYGNSGLQLGVAAYGRRLVKFDLEEEGREKSWTLEGDYIFCEPIFIPRPHGDKEDDGIVSCAVYNVQKEHKSFVVFLCAQTMTELGRAEFKTMIPIYTHGAFVPAGQD